MPRADDDGHQSYQEHAGDGVSVCGTDGNRYPAGRPPHHHRRIGHQHLHTRASEHAHTSTPRHPRAQAPARPSAHATKKPPAHTSAHSYSSQVSRETTALPFPPTSRTASLGRSHSLSSGTHVENRRAPPPRRRESPVRTKVAIPSERHRPFSTATSARSPGARDETATPQHPQPPDTRTPVSLTIPSVSPGPALGRRSLQPPPRTGGRPSRDRPPTVARRTAPSSRIAAVVSTVPHSDTWTARR